MVDDELAGARHGSEGARHVYKQLGFVRSVAALLCVLSFSAVVRAEPRFLFCSALPVNTSAVAKYQLAALVGAIQRGARGSSDSGQPLTGEGSGGVQRELALSP